MTKVFLFLAISSISRCFSVSLTPKSYEVSDSLKKYGVKGISRSISQVATPKLCIPFLR